MTAAGEPKAPKAGRKTAGKAATTTKRAAKRPAAARAKKPATTKKTVSVRKKTPSTKIKATNAPSKGGQPDIADEPQPLTPLETSGAEPESELRSSAAGGLRFASPGKTISKKSAAPAKAGSGLPSFTIPGTTSKAPPRSVGSAFGATDTANAGKAQGRTGAAGKSPLHTIARKAAAKRKLEADATMSPGKSKSGNPNSADAGKIGADKAKTTAATSGPTKSHSAKPGEAGSAKVESPVQPQKAGNRGLVITLVAAAAAITAVLWTGSVEDPGVPNNDAPRMTETDSSATQVSGPIARLEDAASNPASTAEQQATPPPAGEVEATAGSAEPEDQRTDAVATKTDATRRPAEQMQGNVTQTPSTDGRFAAIPPPDAPPALPPGLISAEELMEIERLLARLEFDPGNADGVLDRQSQIAIRLYQEMAGLPINGEPTEELLVDLREVVKLYDTDN